MSASPAFAVIAGGASDEDSALLSTDARAEARHLGRYRLCFELASGGMATVYLARTDGPDGFAKLVALKKIHRHLAKDSEFVEMFLDEARIAARINHPNVCSVFDFGKVDGAYYLAMEFLLGETLARLVRKVGGHDELGSSRRWPLLAARIVAEAAQGLHSAHELRGDDGEPLSVVHRDVSPQNLFVSYDGSVRVVDFGVAKAAGRLHETTSGAIKGKLAYMAPEQARGQAVDRRVDVWALGVCLWELLTRKRLFRRGTQSDTVVAVLHGAIPDPSELAPNVPPGLDRICARALARDPEQRYATARELGDDLMRFAARTATPATMGELSDWMHELFPEERARRQELVDLARQQHVGGVPRVSGALAHREVSGTATGLEPPTVPRRVDGDGRKARPKLALPVLAGVTIAIALWATCHASPAGTEPTPPDTTAPPRQEPTEVRAPPPSPETPAPLPAGPMETSDGEESGPAATAAEPAPQATATRPRPQRSRPRTPAEAPVDDRPGHVNVVTPGTWAEIHWQGRSLGRTPRRMQLPPGNHTIVLTFPDGARDSAPVTVRPGEVSRVSRRHPP